MHRTTTTAALLVTVAVSALSGCVTVQRPAVPEPQPDSAPSQPTAPRPEGGAQPRVVQAPVREALEMAVPSRRPGPSTPSARHRPPATPEATHRRPAPAEAPRPAPRPGPTGRPVTDTPGPVPAVPGAPDVCALGRTYGGWHQDSPEARICAQAYGR
ncbi:hypothetical protein JK359_13580 [Streptomyces actinomycinicus]|uniref:Lipoprotein n=1 Tax=Streptomyces actinomycinicus TaxID=1695166 RepID=A0A937EHM9_9ACTN|nr:hypothetical protein [Streptomyces actinomycinicus]MBL1083001.1 hypothetical protein [Streptomyces actinomycinicus]